MMVTCNETVQCKRINNCGCQQQLDQVILKSLILPSIELVYKDSYSLQDKKSNSAYMLIMSRHIAKCINNKDKSSFTKIDRPECPKGCYKWRRYMGKKARRQYRRHRE